MKTLLKFKTIFAFLIFVFYIKKIICSNIEFLKFRVENNKSSIEENNYRLEFIFDCDVACYIQIHFSAKEMIDADYIQYLFCLKHLLN